MAHALIDTSAVLLGPADLARALDPYDHVAISAATTAELGYGLYASGPDWEERFRRQVRYEWIASTFEELPVDHTVALAFAKIAGLVARTGRRPRRRSMDLLIAATAVAHDLPLVTANPDDLRGAERLLVIDAVRPGGA